MPRRARLDAPGTLHHVMVRGIERHRIVNDVADRKNFVKRLAGLRRRSEIFWEEGRRSQEGISKLCHKGHR